MKATKILGRGLSVVHSDIGLIVRVIMGVKVHFHFISLVSRHAKIKTQQGGKITLGKLTAVSDHTLIHSNGGQIEIGQRCYINRNCIIASHERIFIGEGTTIGPNVCIYDHDHDGNGGYITDPIHIGEKVWIGAGSIILKGVSIGNNSIIGAGSLVTEDVPPFKTFIQKRNTTLIDNRKMEQ